MKNRKIIIGFIIAFFCLLLIETFIYLTYSNTQKDEVKISFIVTGDNLDEWESMKAGAETAALDKDVSVDFVNVPVDLGSEGEQEGLHDAYAQDDELLYDDGHARLQAQGFNYQGQEEGQVTASHHAACHAVAA